MRFAACVIIVTLIPISAAAQQDEGAVALTRGNADGMGKSVVANALTTSNRVASTSTVGTSENPFIAAETPSGMRARAGFAVAAQASGRKRDSLWNGILIGAAVGVLATLTTAAEAPADGKVITVLSVAALGGYIDSRMNINRPGPWWPHSPAPTLRLVHSIRF